MITVDAKRWFCSTSRQDGSFIVLYCAFCRLARNLPLAIQSAFRFAREMTWRIAFDDLWAETFFEFLPEAIDLAIHPALNSK